VPTRADADPLKPGRAGAAAGLSEAQVRLV